MIVLANGKYIKGNKLREDLEPFVINPVQDSDEFSENLSPSQIQSKYSNFSSRSNIFEILSQLNRPRTKFLPRINTKKLLSKSSTKPQKLVMLIEAEDIPLTRKSYNMIPEQIVSDLIQQMILFKFIRIQF